MLLGDDAPVDHEDAALHAHRRQHAHQRQHSLGRLALGRVDTYVTDMHTRLVEHEDVPLCDPQPLYLSAWGGVRVRAGGRVVTIWKRRGELARATCCSWPVRAREIRVAVRGALHNERVEEVGLLTDDDDVVAEMMLFVERGMRGSIRVQPVFSCWYYSSAAIVGLAEPEGLTTVMQFWKVFTTWSVAHSRIHLIDHRSIHPSGRP